MLGISQNIIALARNAMHPIITYYNIPRHRRINLYMLVLRNLFQNPEIPVKYHMAYNIF